MKGGPALNVAAQEFRPWALMSREPNRHYAPDSIHLEFKPTMVGRVIEIHLPNSVTVGRVVGYYLSSDGRSHVQLETTVVIEDGDVMHLGPNTFVVVFVG